MNKENTDLEPVQEFELRRDQWCDKMKNDSQGNGSKAFSDHCKEIRNAQDSIRKFKDKFSPGERDREKSIMNFQGQRQVLVSLAVEQQAALLCASKNWGNEHTRNLDCSTRVRSVDKFVDWLANKHLYETWLASRPERHYLGLCPIFFPETEKARGNPPGEHFFFNHFRELTVCMKDEERPVHKK